MTGKVLIVAMVFTGLLLGGIAWHHRREAGRQILTAWDEYAPVVRHALRVNC